MCMGEGRGGGGGRELILQQLYKTDLDIRGHSGGVGVG